MAKRVQQRSRQAGRKPSRSTIPMPGVAAARPVPATAAPAPDRPAADAVSVFDQAMQALQRHDYTTAAAAFRALISDFPREGALRERSLVYLALCERELARRPAEPRTLEERLTAATAALNDGDDERAETLARAVLAESPQHDLALYLLAAIQARRGEADQALQLLGRALAANPEIRAQARHDADFEDLHDLDAFRELIDAPVESAADASRRPRRHRADR